MKRLAVLILVLLLGGIATESFAQKKGRAVACFQSNMDCVDCEKTLYEYLKFEKGVKDLKVDHASNTIYIEYVNNKNDEKGLAGAIEKKGYEARKIDQETYEKILAQAKEKGHEHQNEVHTVRD
jgi:periplasmic mercuric ion binding protein